MPVPGAGAGSDDVAAGGVETGSGSGVAVRGPSCMVAAAATGGSCIGGAVPAGLELAVPVMCGTEFPGTGAGVILLACAAPVSPQFWYITTGAPDGKARSEVPRLLTGLGAGTQPGGQIGSGKSGSVRSAGVADFFRATDFLDVPFRPLLLGATEEGAGSGQWAKDWPRLT